MGPNPYQQRGAQHDGGVPIPVGHRSRTVVTGFPLKKTNIHVSQDWQGKRGDNKYHVHHAERKTRSVLNNA